MRRCNYRKIGRHHSRRLDEQVNANWKSTLLLMQRFAPDMTERNWGRILTIGSVQELKPHPAMIVYAGTKAAVANTVRNLRYNSPEMGLRSIIFRLVSSTHPAPTNNGLLFPTTLVSA